MPMGPIELADVVGLDVAAHVGEIIARELRRGRAGPDAAARAGRRQEARAARAARASTLERRQAGEARRAAAPRRQLTCIDRLILVLVNECVACLRDAWLRTRI